MENVNNLSPIGRHMLLAFLHYLHAKELLDKKCDKFHWVSTTLWLSGTLGLIMNKLTDVQKQLIEEEIRQLRLFARRHYDWMMDIEEPSDRKPHRYIRGELDGMADEINRLFFGFRDHEQAGELKDIDPTY